MQLLEGGLIFDFLKFISLQSNVNKLPSKLDLPLMIIFKASVASISPTIPGNIPMTPRAEQPPEVFC